MQLKLKDAAIRGILVLPDKKFIAQIANKSAKRAFLRAFNAHNDKLGFDWSLVKNGLVADTEGRHYRTSKYFQKGGFLYQAAKFQHNQNPEYAEHLIKALRTFVKQPLEPQGAIIPSLTKSD